MIERTAAEVFFGATTPTTPATAPAPAPAAPAAPAATPAPPKGDEQTAAEVLFDGANDHGDAERAIQNTLIETDLTTPEEAAAVAQEWRPVFQTLQLNSSESTAMANLGAAVYRNPPSPETLAGWANEAKAALLQDFGPGGVGQALADAKAWVARDPKLVQYLNETGLGSHPSVVRLAAAKARAAKR
jgi:hypothetical protein